MIKKLILLAIAVLAVSCSPENGGTGLSSINNSHENKLVSVYGQTITVSFNAEAGWTAELLLNGGGDWATISEKKGSDKAGQGIIRVRFNKNESTDERTAELYVSVSGHDKELVATFTQAAADAGQNTSAMSEYLNNYMHERLVKEYLWADEYKKLDVDMSVSYDKFLYTNLTKLGDINIEDGGYYREYSSSAGERYIYSYISELTTTKVATKAGELAETYGLGLGPLFASVFEEGTDYIGLTVGYVYPGSPAEAAGIRRGDTIFQVGSNRITRNNYQNYMRELFYNPKGTYNISFARYVANEAMEKYDLILDNTVSVTAGNYGYNPIIFAAILTNSEVDSGSNDLPSFNIGYMASESFDSSAQEVLEYQIQQFIEAGITELILDLRYNVGGEVQQSRYLASSIVGSAYDDQYFFKAEFNDGKVEPWKFRSGPAESDRLGQAPSMNLKRLWVIMSENTASASELIIHGLKGVDFPVTLIGSRSEGKNVGMVVTQEVYNGRRFEFAPITYRGLNAKDQYAPSDGFEPDAGNLLNNQDSSYRNDVDNMFPYAFGDWGNFDFNIALYCCFCDIIGEDRPDYGSATRSSDFSLAGQAAEIQNSAEPFGSTELKKEIGRFGNVIRR